MRGEIVDRGTYLEEKTKRIGVLFSEGIYIVPVATGGPRLLRAMLREMRLEPSGILRRNRFLRLGGLWWVE